MNGKMLKWLMPAVGAALLVLGTTQVQATALLPGTAVIPDNVGLGGSPSIVAQISGTFSTPGGDTGSYREVVLSGDTNNPGGLDFVFQFTNNSSSPDALVNLSSLSFTGFTTDVSQVASVASSLGFATGTVGATTASRTSSADEVLFNYGTAGLGTLAPGSTSDVMIIRTNGTNFVTGNIGITDGGTDNVTGFAPSPEPSSLVLLGSCLAGLGSVGAWRRRRKAT